MAAKRRVRFQPGFPDVGLITMMCSDTANQGLHAQTGEFLCSATRANPPDLHGPLQVARDQQHLEHADRTLPLAR